MKIRFAHLPGRLVVGGALFVMSAATLFATDMRLGVPGPHSFVVAPLVALVAGACLVAFAGTHRVSPGSTHEDVAARRQVRPRRVPLTVEGIVLIQRRSRQTERTDE